MAPRVEIQVGSTTLNDADLANESAALAQIGAALAPGGNLQLYSCVTAKDANGQQFIASSSSYVGAPVFASSLDIGQTARGENWTLNTVLDPVANQSHSTAALVQVSNPFTVNAEAQFSATLGASAADPELWVAATFGANENLLLPFGDDDGTGSGTTTNVGRLLRSDQRQQSVGLRSDGQQNRRDGPDPARHAGQRLFHRVPGVRQRNGEGRGRVIVHRAIESDRYADLRHPLHQ